jgi:5'-3' exonuclease
MSTNRHERFHQSQAVGLRTPRPENAPIDYLYLDANGLLHKAAQTVFNYGQERRLMRMRSVYASMTPDQKRTAVYSMFLNKVMDIITAVRPTTLAYLALDGTAPRAKQAQQRQRRFVAARSTCTSTGTSASAGTDVGTSSETSSMSETSTDASKERISSPEFSSMEITPGTQFMHGLDVFLQRELPNVVSKVFQSRGMENTALMYSPPSVPGEGEHVLMDYMRRLPAEDRENRTHCLFGPDGDLIMLCLSVHIPKMFLLREDDQRVGDFKLSFDFVDIGNVRNNFIPTLKTKPVTATAQIATAQIATAQTKSSATSPSTLIRDVVNDFVLIGFFVGNDFLPRIKMFYSLEDGLEKLVYEVMNIRFGTKRDGAQFGCTTTVTTPEGLRSFVKTSDFTELISRLAKVEKEYLESQTRKTASEPRFEDNTLKKHVSVTGTVTGNGSKANPLFDFLGYREDYYVNSFLTAGLKYEDFDTTEKFEYHVQRKCADYFRNILWVFDYYVKTLMSWSECYEWHYAPLMIDFHKYLVGSFASESGSGLSSYVGPIDRPALPFEQLLGVCPPTKAHLIPQIVNRICTSPNSELVKRGYYDMNFTIDYEGKTKEYQGIAHLKFMDTKLLRKMYTRMVTSIESASSEGRKMGDLFPRSRLTVSPLTFRSITEK